jgi:hypothetical protein
MSYGIEIQNPSGYVVVDDQYKRMVVTQSGTANTSAVVMYSPQPTNPIVFIRPPTGTWFIRIGSATDRFSILPVYGSASFSYDYYVVDHDPSKWALDSGSSGLIVTDAANNKIFDSRSKFINVDTTVTWNLSKTALAVATPYPNFGRRFVMANVVLCGLETANVSSMAQAFMISAENTVYTKVDYWSRLMGFNGGTAWSALGQPTTFQTGFAL